jgi:hypothetical protein
MILIEYSLYDTNKNPMHGRRPKKVTFVKRIIQRESHLEAVCYCDIDRF